MEITEMEIDAALEKIEMTNADVWAHVAYTKVLAREHAWRTAERLTGPLYQAACFVAAMRYNEGEV